MVVPGPADPPPAGVDVDADGASDGVVKGEPPHPVAASATAAAEITIAIAIGLFMGEPSCD
jgi:hypothetical protein